MRNRLMIGTAALLLASASFARAQDQPQQTDKPQPPPAAAEAVAPETESGGSVDVGGRFTSTTGDEARYERYRDLRDGVNANLLYKKTTPDWTFDLRARDIGYRDQNYQLNFNSHRVQLFATFDQTPLNYAYYARTPYDCTAGNCALDPNLRAQVQAGQAVGIPQNVAQLKTGSIYDGAANQFDMRSRRDTIFAQAKISATDNLDFIFKVNSYKRTGDMPYGASFGFNYAVELPVVVDNRETELSAAVEWASHQGMFHLGYQHSKFAQDIPNESFTFDNPSRATDFCKVGIAGQAPGTCYDPSGYVNGNGAAVGRSSLPPSNTLDTVDWMGMVKLPGHTTANASFSTGASRQDAALIPWTTNTSIANPAVYAAFPGLAELPRSTADMRVNYTSGSMNLSSRPSKYVTLDARYRFNSRTDFTSEFDATEYVRFDAVPEETGGPTEPFTYNRNTLDVNAQFNVIPRSGVRVGYIYDRSEHTFRSTEGWKDNTAYVSFDTVGNQWLTLRARYDHTNRDSIGLSVDDLAAAGLQPATRLYDEAARHRDRGTVMLSLTPTSSIGVDFSLFTGKDDYQGADSSQQFGLLDNKNTGYSVDVTYAPSAKVNVGAEYGRETYNWDMQSRSANPAPDPSWTDPTRNWTLNSDEKSNFVTAYVNLIKALKNTDLRIAYDFSDMDQPYVFAGPWIGKLSATPPGQFIPLPNVTNKWHQLTVDLRYSFSKKLGVGAFYMYEKFEVSDFAAINTAGPQSLPVAALGAQTSAPRIDWIGELSTGYAVRPYTGSTGIIRVFYTF